MCWGREGQSQGQPTDRLQPASRHSHPSGATAGEQVTGPRQASPASSPSSSSKVTLTLGQRNKPDADANARLTCCARRLCGRGGSPDPLHPADPRLLPWVTALSGALKKPLALTRRGGRVFKGERCVFDALALECHVTSYPTRSPPLPQTSNGGCDTDFSEGH